ncbi:phytoene desaturase family protein [Microbacterium radiodurans]|uniref:Phytoene desaturase n=1 Tax=Microbacterium radiodurans TaxID=661398 RepID=A0A5J5ISU3_9MICO|nr:phytoene desaturase family protein [Microbacterium radiodurans]KAA9086703.1 phytoene desaturase [Microbacterium radiodurans]
MSRPSSAVTGSQRVVVIGGGIAGLATAALLAEEGHSVVVVEARGETGGRAGSWEHDGFRFDTGPSWYLMPEVFDHFFALLGTSAAAELDLVPLSPAYRVYGEPEGTGPAEAVDVVSGRAEATALFESREAGAGDRLADYLDSAGDAYDLSVTKFLYDTYASSEGLRDPDLLRRLPTLAPLLTRSLVRHIESRFDDPILRQILGYPAVFLGSSPYDVPSLYHLMSHLDLDDAVLYPRGGFTEVIAAIERLAVARGVEVRTGIPVAQILTGTDGRARGVRLADTTELDADIVVSTADLHHTETVLLPPDQRSYPESWWRKRTPSFGALLVLLGVEGELPELAHHTLLFTRDWRENFEAISGRDATIPDPASLYVCRPSATDDTVAPAGAENLFVLVPIPADPALGRGGVDGAGDALIEAAADRAIDQIASWTGASDLRARIRVRRTIAPGDFAADLGAWRGNALGLAHTLGQSALFRPGNASKKVSGLLYAGGSVLPGIGLPMCLISAELVVKRLRGDTSAGPIAEPIADEAAIDGGADAGIATGTTTA